MYTYVKNIFSHTDEHGCVPLYIKIDTVEEMDVYEFFLKLSLLKQENPFDVHSGISIDSIQFGELSEIQTDIANLCNAYAFLGVIDFNIQTTDNKIEVVIEMVLNKHFKNSKVLNKRIQLGECNVHN